MAGCLCLLFGTCSECVNQSEVKASAKLDTCSILRGKTTCASNFGIIMFKIQTSKFGNYCELVSQFIFDTGLKIDFERVKGNQNLLK